jgi:hypothetical protein
VDLGDARSITYTGNVMTNVDTLPFFILYYTLIVTLAFFMFQRVRILKVS